MHKLFDRDGRWEIRLPASVDPRVDLISLNHLGGGCECCCGDEKGVASDIFFLWETENVDVDF